MYVLSLFIYYSHRLKSEKLNEEKNDFVSEGFVIYVKNIRSACLPALGQVK